MLGFSVMMNQLCGNEETVKAFRGAVGKTIESVVLAEVDNANLLKLAFTDKTAIVIYDDGQSCCESRYMRTDDDLKGFVGAKLMGGEIKDAPPVKESEYDEEHEVQFLELQTDKGVITFSNHVEHNGYYGGFSIVVRDASE